MWSCTSYTKEMTEKKPVMFRAALLWFASRLVDTSDFHRLWGKKTNKMHSDVFLFLTSSRFKKCAFNSVYLDEHRVNPKKNRE